MDPKENIIIAYLLLWQHSPHLYFEQTHLSAPIDEPRGQNRLHGSVSTSEPGRHACVGARSCCIRRQSLTRSRSTARVRTPPGPHGSVHGLQPSYVASLQHRAKRTRLLEPSHSQTPTARHSSEMHSVQRRSLPIVDLFNRRRFLRVVE